MGNDSGLLSTRVKAHLNLFFVVMATLLLGNAIHLSVVTGEHAVTDAEIVGQVIMGCVFGAIGVWFRKAPKERQIANVEQKKEDEEFDEEFSPLDKEDLERLEK